MTLLAILSGSVAVASFVLLVASLRARSLLQSRSILSVMPANFYRNAAEAALQAQQHGDFKCSWLIKLCWPMIVSLGLCVQSLMTWSVRQRLTHALNQAGISGWSCSQFLALQLLLALSCSVLFYIIFRLIFFADAGFALGGALLIALLSGVTPRLWLRSKKIYRYAEIEKDLPFFLDIVSLGLEAGMNLQTSVQLALEHLHAGPLKEEWTQTMFEIRSGVIRADAFRHMSQRINLTCIRQMVVAFIQGESMGYSLGRSIADFSRQQGQYRLLRSEKLALQAPIKMLFPLSFCIFPCTFLVLGFPVAAQLMGLEL